MKSNPYISIIIPAYNEENRLASTLEKVIAWRNSVPYSVEILVVENGSVDSTTEIASDFARRDPGIRLLHSEKGKGIAVKKGMLEADGELLFMCDADLSMPIEELEKFLSPDLSDCDVIIASREVDGATRYDEPFYRHMMGRVFNYLVNWMAVPKFEDTQCGFKLFKRGAAIDLFSSLTIYGWTFDVEILFLALQRQYKIQEIPIDWYYNSDSRVQPVRDTWQMLKDLLIIRQNARQGIYREVLSQPQELNSNAEPHQKVG